ncbi:MAG: LuxR C-terminal-related transcriptional regulator [Nitrospiria bacterium]
MLNTKSGKENSSFSYKTSEGLVVMDKTGKVLYANSCASEMFGYSDGEIEGKYCYETCGGHDLSGNRYCFSNCAVLEMAKRDELVQNFDIQLVNRKGKKIWLNVTTLLESNSCFNVAPKIIHIFRQTASPMGLENYFRQSVSDFLDASVNKDPGISKFTKSESRVESTARKFLLSPRETEVFQLLTQGYGTQVIAEMLHLSPTTVRTHVQRILKKLQVHSMLEAVALVLGEKPAKSAC